MKQFHNSDELREASLDSFNQVNFWEVTVVIMANSLPRLNHNRYDEISCHLTVEVKYVGTFPNFYT
jgi:hypothetical protein